MDQHEEAKLQELRCKTTRQLVSLIGNKLDRGLAFARVLEAGSQGWASGERFVVKAQRELAEASAWMPLLDGATRLERSRLEFKLAQLRDALNRMSESELRARAAC